MKKRKKATLLVLIFTMCIVQAQENKICLECHEDSLISAKKFEQSVHADLGCTGCHSGIILNEDMEHEPPAEKVNCGNCHEDVANEFEMYQHGKLFAQRYMHSEMSKEFPTCISCHDPHGMLPSDDPASLLQKKNQPKMCNRCHGKHLHINGSTFATQKVVDEYLKSYHYKSLLEKGEGASCIDCHGSHDISMIRDPNSKTCFCNLDKTCGTCHPAERDDFAKSIHYIALKAGISGAPTCSDCHKSHSILPPEDIRSPLNPANAGHYSCAKCHNNDELMKRYGLRKDRVSSYEDSYHGLAARRGSKKVAYCQDCHGGHIILPATNPESTINPYNLPETCRQCHPDATPEFSKSYTHESFIVEQSPINTWIRRIYIFLIVAFLTFAFFHNGIVWFHYVKQKMEKINEEPILRMNFFERVQHTLLFLSFFTLVITGFALKFPDADWVHLLRKILGTTEESRALIHRIAAIVLIFDSLLHLLYVTFTERGRKLFKAFIPGFKDMVDLIENIKYYLGFRKTQPAFGKFDYTEKIEYWALIWGTIIMAITGIILWFPTFFTSWLPGWVIRAAELIHYFEAWLATLSILFYHFFFVIFHPEEYPMNLSWLTGKMNRTHYQEKHPADEEPNPF